MKRICLVLISFFYVKNDVFHISFLEFYLPIRKVMPVCLFKFYKTKNYIEIQFCFIKKIFKLEKHDS